MKKQTNETDFSRFLRRALIRFFRLHPMGMVNFCLRVSSLPLSRVRPRLERVRDCQVNLVVAHYFAITTASCARVHARTRTHACQHTRLDGVAS